MFLYFKVRDSLHSKIDTSQKSGISHIFANVRENTTTTNLTSQETKLVLDVIDIQNKLEIQLQDSDLLISDSKKLEKAFTNSRDNY